MVRNWQITQGQMITDLFLGSASNALQCDFHTKYLTGWLRTMEITSQVDWAHKFTGMVWDNRLLSSRRVWTSSHISYVIDLITDTLYVKLSKQILLFLNIISKIWFATWNNLRWILALEDHLWLLFDFLATTVFLT